MKTTTLFFVMMMMMVVVVIFSGVDVRGWKLGFVRDPHRENSGRLLFQERISLSLSLSHFEQR